MADLRTRYLGLELPSPLVASSSPLTGTLDGLRRLEAAGVGAVVLPSLFEEDLAEETEQVEALRATGATGAEARAGHPDQAGYGAGPAAYLSLVTQAKQTLSVPVIASLNGVSRGGWVRYAGPAGGGRGRRPGAQHLLCVLAAGEFLERGRVALPGRGPGGPPGHRDPAGGQAQPLFQLAGQPGRPAGRGRRQRAGAVQPLLPARPGHRDHGGAAGAGAFQLDRAAAAAALDRHPAPPLWGVAGRLDRGPHRRGRRSRCCWPGRTWP